MRQGWLPCEVRPGPFSNERLVRVPLSGEDWVGFVQDHHLCPPVQEGRSWVRVKAPEGHVGVYVHGESWNMACIPPDRVLPATETPMSQRQLLKQVAASSDLAFGPISQEFDQAGIILYGG